MPSRTCTEMKEAQKLMVETGCSAYAAAKATGLSATAITQSAWYKLRKSNGIGGVSGKAKVSEEKMLQARTMIEAQVSLVRTASVVGVSESTIRKAEWYKNLKSKPKG